MFEHLEMIAVGAGLQLPELTRRQQRRLRRACRGKRFSANLVVDIGNTSQYFPSFVHLSGTAIGVGVIVDLLHANTHTNLYAAGWAASGEVPILIQTSDATTSGTFTDPTSGLPASVLNVAGSRIASGGVWWLNSGTFNSGNDSPAQNQINAAPLFASGGIDFGAFQRPHRYARLMSLSGANVFQLTAGFVAQKKLTGISGTAGGFSFSPGSGTITAV